MFGCIRQQSAPGVPNIPGAFIFQKRWAIAGGKRGKTPIHPSGCYAKVSDPSTWSAYDEVRNYRHGVFLDGDCTVVDLDHCLENGTLSDFARDFLKRIPGNAYVELSQSLTGLHVFFPGMQLSGSGIKCTQIEIYSKERFIVMGTPAPEFLSYRDATLPSWTTEELESFRAVPSSPKSKKAPNEPGTNSPSEEDWAFVCSRMEKGFSDNDVIESLLKERWREKLSRKDYVERTIANARQHVSTRHRPSRRWKVPTKATPTIRKLWQYVEAHGLLPWSFSLDYGRIATILGASKRNAWKQIRYAAALGQIVIVHPGWQGCGGRNTAAIFALVDRRGNAQESLQLAKQYRLYKERTERFNRAEAAVKNATLLTPPVVSLTVVDTGIDFEAEGVSEEEYRQLYAEFEADLRSSVSGTVAQSKPRRRSPRRRKCQTIWELKWQMKMNMWQGAGVGGFTDEQRAKMKRHLESKERSYGWQSRNGKAEARMWREHLVNSELWYRLGCEASAPRLSRRLKRQRLSPKRPLDCFSETRTIPDSDEGAFERFMAEALEEERRKTVAVVVPDATRAKVVAAKRTCGQKER